VTSSDCPSRKLLVSRHRQMFIDLLNRSSEGSQSPDEFGQARHVADKSKIPYRRCLTGCRDTKSCHGNHILDPGPSHLFCSLVSRAG
jgi:hypothetical protein